jgi:hypothetical protein
MAYKAYLPYVGRGADQVNPPNKPQLVECWQLDLETHEFKWSREDGTNAKFYRAPRCNSRFKRTISQERKQTIRNYKRMARFSPSTNSILQNANKVNEHHPYVERSC